MTPPPATAAAAANTNLDLSALIVDDDAFVRMVVVKALKALNIGTVYEAANGGEAIAVLRAMGHDVDLVICDLQMPDVDGIQTLEALAELGTRAGIVIQSAHQEQTLTAAAEFARAHGLNILGTLGKPVKRDSLSAIVDKIWDGNSLPSAVSRPIVRIEKEELADAIKNGDLSAFYQPKICVANKRPVGVEALVRWQHPEYGLLGPGAFVPMAEEAGLIGDLTKSVLNTALKDCADLIRNGRLQAVAVNLSAAALKDRGLTDYILATIERRGLKPQNLILEVTENLVIEDLRAALHILSRLHLKDIKLSIDDFGTGYSGLQQLLRIPFSELKIDRLFVFEAHDNAVQRTILEATVDLAHRLGMVTTAEGVETQQDWDLLANLGTSQIQGYFIHKPAPIGEITDWLDSQEVTNLAG